MRIRLQILLPLAVAGFVAIGFLLIALLVGGAIRDSLTTIPGLTAERAVEAAVRVVGIVGVIITALAGVAAAVIARMIVAPLSRMRQAAERLGEEEADQDQDTPVAEIQDVARGISRAAGELRARHGREVRERSELAGLVEAVSEGIIQLDREGRVTRVNRAGRTLLGLPANALGQHVGVLFRDLELRQIMKSGAAGEGTEGAEVVVDEQRILVSVSPQADGGAVATFVDLTDLRRLEEVRRDFVANASHELKTPLTSIRGYTETLMSGVLPDSERMQFLLTIARNAERLQRIVDDLLDLSRLDAGRWQPDLEPVDVLQAAESSWLSFADRASDQGVTFSAKRSTEDRALADQRALEQIFVNLYDNALRYTPGNGRIRVTTRTQDVPPGSGNGPRRVPPLDHREVRGPWLVTEVADTGTGIPRDALPRIFERFYRVDPARSRAEGGTGLGLAIVRHMLEGMDGGVEAYSELGNGTIIRFWLPVTP